MGLLKKPIMGPRMASAMCHSMVDSHARMIPGLAGPEQGRAGHCG